MNTRFVRFVLGAALFFYGISDHGILHLAFWFRATIALAGAYMFINVIQHSDND